MDVRDFVAHSPPMRRLTDLVLRFAKLDAPALIVGEKGTGKRLVAQALHRLSPRANQACITVHCATQSKEFLASELFGQEKGTHATGGLRQQGQFERAEGGTLFLIQPGDLPLEVQASISRFLSEGYIVHVGGQRAVKLNVRVFASLVTPVGSDPMIAGTLQEDLFYKLCPLLLRVPPLRERREDIDVLANRVLRDSIREFTRNISGFSPAAIAALRDYSWPGNVRQFVAVIRRAILIAQGPRIEVHDLELSPINAEPNVTTPESRPQPGSSQEREMLRAALARAGNNMTRAAEQLGVSRVTLYRMIRRTQQLESETPMSSSG